MQSKHFLFSLVACILFANINAMKRAIPKITHKEPIIIIVPALPEELWIDIIARSTVKNKFRELSSYFRTLASRNTKEIFFHDQLKLNMNCLKTFIIYYTDLGEDTIVKNLLRCGANPNLKGDHGMSLMNYATQNKSITMLTMLLNHPNMSTANITRGKEMLDRLTKKNGNELIEQLTPVSGREKALALFHYAKFNDTTIEDSFLCDIDYKDKQKALSLAAMHGSINIARALLANKVNPNFMSREFHGSPLHGAARRGYTLILKILVENGARINDKNFHHFTSLHCAIRDGYINSVQFLLDQGASVTTRGGVDNETSLIMAIKFGYIKIIELLLNNHADVNEKVSFGDVALHYAIYYKRVNIIRKLLSHPDIHINAQNDSDETPLDIAFKTEQMHVVSILLENGGKKGFAIRWNQMMQQ